MSALRARASCASRNRIAPPLTLLDRAIVLLLPAVPKPVVQMFSARYIAGPSRDDAVRVVKQLNTEGKLATIDVLGEEIAHEEDARAIAQAYRDVFDEIASTDLDSNVSVKLTALGLGLSYDLCRANLEGVVRQAKEDRNFVRIDMEDSSATDDTLRLYRELREGGHDNVGIVLQAYLRRTLAVARASTSSRRRSRSPAQRRSARTSSAASMRCSTRAPTSASRHMTNG